MTGAPLSFVIMPGYTSTLPPLDTPTVLVEQIHELFVYVVSSGFCCLLYMSLAFRAWRPFPTIHSNPDVLSPPFPSITLSMAHSLPHALLFQLQWSGKIRGLSLAVGDWSIPPRTRQSRGNQSQNASCIMHHVLSPHCSISPGLWG